MMVQISATESQQGPDLKSSDIRAVRDRSVSFKVAEMDRFSADSQNDETSSAKKRGLQHPGQRTTALDPDR